MVADGALMATGGASGDDARVHEYGLRVSMQVGDRKGKGDDVTQQKKDANEPQAPEQVSCIVR